MNQIVKNLDSIVLSTPIAIPAAAAAGFSFLERSEKPSLQNPIIKGIGWFGCRFCVLAGAIGGIPLLVWSAAKAVLAKGINAATLGRFQGVKDFARESNRNFTLTLIGVPAALVSAIYAPVIWKAGVKTYEIWNKVAEAWKGISEKLEKSGIDLSHVLDNVKDFTQTLSIEIEKQKQEDAKKTPSTTLAPAHA